MAKLRHTHATLAILAILALVQIITPKTTEEWKKMSIYQIITDRFAKGDGSFSGCEDFADYMHYCGGKWIGITK